MHDKIEIVKILDTIATERLFGAGNWLVNCRATADALHRTLQPLGLDEPVPNTINTTRNTELGKELNFDLYMVFMGLWEPWDAIYVLEEGGLISNDDADELYALLEFDHTHYEEKFRARVQRAYRDYHQATSLH